MRRQIFTLLVLCAGFMGPVTAFAVDDAPFDAVILGDSISTGGGTHPALKYDPRVLWDVFNGKILTPADPQYLDQDFQTGAPSPLVAPRRLWPTMREFLGGPHWVYRVLLTTLSHVFLDTEEYSWGYLAATKAGLDGARIGIAAEDGARVASMPRQIDRVLAESGGAFAKRVFLFYTGNDLCGMDPGLMTTGADYEKELRRGLEYLAFNLPKERRDEGPLPVYLLSFMSMAQLLTSDDILSKKVYAFGKEVTCKELRESAYRPIDASYQPNLPPEAMLFSMTMPPNPAAFCPTVFLPQHFPKHDVAALANRIRDFREAEAKVAAEYQRNEKSPIKLRYITATASLQFSADEVAEDCFHLSLKGQEKVARTVLEETSGSL